MLFNFINSTVRRLQDWKVHFSSVDIQIHNNQFHISLKFKHYALLDPFLKAFISSIP